MSLGAPAAANGFPLNNFKHYLTLFSKFFSSFPHGTCSLSVSRQYLALDGTYHQLRAAFPNNPTLRVRSRGATSTRPTGLSPSTTAASTALGPGWQQGPALYTTIRLRRGDFHDGLFPFRSPLLRESWLVSFPPLIDMLKFSG